MYLFHLVIVKLEAIFCWTWGKTVEQFLVLAMQCHNHDGIGASVVGASTVLDDFTRIMHFMFTRLHLSYRGMLSLRTNDVGAF
jgi:hypothetical protein